MKLKTLALTFTLAVASCVGTTAYANQKEQQCDLTADIIYEVTVARDRGISPEGMYKVLVDFGLPMSTADLMVRYTFFMHPTKDPYEMRSYFYRLCVTDPV